MDYLFYGNVTTSKKINATTISLHIYCELDETLHLYALVPDASHQLAYKRLSVERSTDGLSAVFDVQDNYVSLFIISGQSNESSIPFEVTYAVYNGEVVSLPENNIVQLEGATCIFPNGERKCIE